MELSRRECLKLGALAGVGGLVGGCTNLPRSQTTAPLDFGTAKIGTSPETRLLNRLAFGHNRNSLEDLRSLGREAYVKRELSASEKEEPALLFALSRLDILRMNNEELQDLPQEEMLRQLQQAAILRAVYGRNQLKERMADFWGNHFNIYARKEGGVYRKNSDEESVVRKHALGTFPDLVKGSSRSPAMLAYLDNQVNTKGVANENYARELLELHTMGVDGGYSQRDVQEVARCFTGWTVETRFLRPRGNFIFRDDLHDSGAKTVLGQTIPAGGGAKDAERVVDIVAAHPATAKFISKKLSRYFLGEEETKWTAKLEKAYTESNGDIKHMLEPLLLSPDLLESGGIMKRPFDYMVSALRATEAVTDGNRIQQHLADMGQPLFQWPMPDGYPDRTEAWTGSLLARWNFALDLTNNRIPGTQVRLEGSGHGDDVGKGLLGDDTSAKPLLKSFTSAGGKLEEAAALALSSPEFQWR